MNAATAVDAGVHAVLPMAQCIPTNDLFTSILANPITLFTGGLGGLLNLLVLMVIVILAVIAVVKIIRSKRANEDISAILWVMVIPMVAVLAIAIQRGAMAAIGTMC